MPFQVIFYSIYWKSSHPYMATQYLTNKLSSLFFIMCRDEGKGEQQFSFIQSLKQNSLSSAAAKEHRTVMKDHTHTRPPSPPHITEVYRDRFPGWNEQSPCICDCPSRCKCGYRCWSGAVSRFPGRWYQYKSNRRVISHDHVTGSYELDSFLKDKAG